MFVFVVVGTLLFAAALVAVVALGFYWASRLLLERPNYQVQEADPPFQLRSYPGLLVAQIQTAGSRTVAMRQGFRPLSQYISSGNQVGAKISMTSPVFQERIEDELWRVRFTMPSGWTFQNLPKPLRQEIQLEQLPERKVAVIRFSGRLGDPKFEDKERELKDWIEARGLKATGPVGFAYYDPPFVPPMLRRNEVWMEVVAA